MATVRRSYVTVDPTGSSRPEPPPKVTDRHPEDRRAPPACSVERGRVHCTRWGRQLRAEPKRAGCTVAPGPLDAAPRTARTRPSTEGQAALRRPGPRTRAWRSRGSGTAATRLRPSHELLAVAREQSWTSRHRAFKGTRHPRLQICSLKVTEAKSSVSIFTQPHPRWGNLISFKGDSVF